MLEQITNSLRSQCRTSQGCEYSYFKVKDIEYLIKNMDSANSYNELLKITIQLIRYHYEHNDEKFKEYCHNFIKSIKEYDTDGQIKGYILAQMGDVLSFIPM